MRNHHMRVRVNITKISLSDITPATKEVNKRRTNRPNVGHRLRHLLVRSRGNLVTCVVGANGNIVIGLGPQAPRVDLRATILRHL